MSSHAELLSGLSLFSRLSPEALDELTAHASLVKLPKESLVYREGDPADALFVVVSGRCKSFLTMPDGTEHVLAIYGPGETFGERALLATDRHWSTVRVITDCSLLRISAEDVQIELDRNPLLARLMARRMNEQYDAMRARSVRGRGAPRGGRVVGMASVSSADLGTVVIENIAAALRTETGESVLLLTVRTEPAEVSLDTWQEARTYLNGRFFYAQQVQEGSDGVSRLLLRVRGDTAEMEKIAGFVSHTAQHFRYVLVRTDANLPVPASMMFLIQADVSYIFLRPQSDELYRANMLVRHLQMRPGGGQVRLLPIVCVEGDEEGGASRTLAGQIGLRPHGYIHALPRDETAPQNHYRNTPRDRFSAHVRYVAREIGRRRIGLVLSAGGAKALAHVGVIQVLEENHIDVDIVAGSSMGAFIGALWCHGIDGKRIGELALQMERPYSLVRIVDFSFTPRRGFMKGHRVRRMLQNAIGDVLFSELQRPLRVIVTDLATLEREVLDSGEVVDAVHASMAMPGLVVPVKLEGHVYIDGGASDPLPVDVLVKAGVDHIIAVNTIPTLEDLKAFSMINRPAEKSPVQPELIPPLVDQFFNYFHEGNILDTFVRSMTASQIRIAEASARAADIALSAVSSDGVWHDFKHAGKYIALGRRAAEQHLDQLRALAPKSP